MASYIDPKIKYTPREREIYYWNNKYQFESYYEFLQKLCVMHEGKYVIPSVYLQLSRRLKSRLLRSEKILRKHNSYKHIDYLPNRYEILPNSEGRDVIYDEEEEFIPSKVYAHKIKDDFPLLVDYVKKLKFVDTLKYENSYLLQKIKIKLNILRCKRMSKFSRLNFINYLTLKDYKLEANMDTIGAQGENIKPNVESAGNTLQETQRDASRGLPAKIVSRVSKLFNKLASAESSSDYKELTNRYFPHKTYEWKGESEHPTNTKIVDLTLPLDFVVQHPNAPNCTLFESYSYWDGDLEVKIMVNANKFQVGQLQMSWYYGQDYELNFDRRDNIFTASQQAHCLVSASTSNEGYLYIPFRYYKPKMGTKLRDDDPGFLNMGNLSVRVINPLRCPSNVYKACTFTISFRFVNSNFSGMIARDLGSSKVKLESNMFAVRAAMRVLEELNQDPQRDNPPIVSPPTHMVPWSAHSWSIGDKATEPINSLRLQAPGQTPHPAEVTPEFDEMKINYVVSIFGLTCIQNWKSSNRQGDLLFYMDGAPIQNFSRYYKCNFDGTLNYAMPPLAVLSNCFSYWRGSIELRLDVIASPFHTGRLLIAYIPRVMDQPTFEQAKGSPHMIIDLQGESRQFLFKIPFIADRPWWHTSSFANSILPPSRVYCFVMNELVAMDNVAGDIDINVYMRGCDDFELSVPVSPRLGLSTYNARIIQPAFMHCFTKDGYTPIYIGAWHSLASSTKMILRYGNVSDHIVQVENCKKGSVYIQDVVKNKASILGPNDRSEWYIVGLNIDVVNNFCPYITYFDTMSKAIAYAATYDISALQDYTEDSAWFKDSTGQRWDKKIYFQEIPLPTKVEQKVQKKNKKIQCNSCLADCLCYLDTFMEGQMDERKITTNDDIGILPSVQSTNSGLLTFGESFDDLKALCRRYQLYTYVSSSFVSTANIQRVKIPLLPQGIPRTNQELENVSQYNINREGIIPIVASAYRFYRGGLRFRLVWKSDWHTTIRLEHRPDERLKDYSQIIDRDHRNALNDGYAFIIQNTAVNNIIEFEIPFYQCGVLGLLQHPKIRQDLESYHFSLGYLYVNFNNYKPDASFELYYSLADDCRFSVFQGFPMMMRPPNMQMEGQMGLISDIRSTVSNLKNGSDKLNIVVDKVDKLVPEVENKGEDNPTDQASFIQWITCNVPKNICAAMINGVSQLFHCFINPTIKTICWALASFLMSIGVLCSSLVVKFSDLMTQFMQLFSKKESAATQASEGKLPPDTIEAQMGEQEKDAIALKAGIVSTVISSIVAAMGSVGRLPKNIPDFMKGIWNNVGKFATNTNALCTFFKNNLRWITNCYKWVLSKVCPKKALASELEGADNDLQKFVTEALELTSAVNERKIEFHPRWNLRVYKCAAEASLLYMRMASVKDAPKTPALYALMQAVLKKRDQLVRAQMSPPVRFEPFVMAVVGDSNVGKSHFCQNIGKHLLKTINYKTYEELIYTRTPGNPYWNMLRNQPICLYDDYIAVGGEYGLQQAAELFCLKSRAVFNPPQADISDKHIRYNPLLVFLAMNNAFPKVAGVENNEAFFRRRDVLIKVEQNAAVYAAHNVNLKTGTPKMFPLDKIANYEHLNFRIAKNVKDVNTEYSEVMTYKQLIDKLTHDFSIFYEREMEMYNGALSQVYDFYPEETDRMTISDDLIAQQKTLDKINKYRFGSILELKGFLQTAVKLINTKDSKYIVPLITNLEILYIYDKETTKDIIVSNQLLMEYCVDRGLFSKIDFKTHIPSKFIPQVGELQYCPHISFNESMYFDKGMFKCPVTKLECSESPCTDNDHCCWLKPEAYVRDMAKWKEYKKIAYERKIAFDNNDFSQLPKYFHLQKSENKDRYDFEVKVVQEAESWKQWSLRILKSVGSGIWTALLWASRIVILLSGVIGLVGVCRDWYYPEKKEVRLNKALVQDQHFYYKSFQDNCGKIDATTIINAELMNGEHYTQKVYPDLNKQEANMVASGDFKTFGKKDPIKVKDVAIKMIGNMSVEKENNLVRLIRRNTMFIEAKMGDKVISGRILGLIDHYALAVDHYNDKLSKLEGDQIVNLVGNNFSVEVPYKLLKYKKFSNSCLGYYSVPLQIPAFRNLLKHIATQKDHRKIGPISKLVESDSKNNTTVITEQYCERVNSVAIDGSNGFEPFMIADGYKYARGGRGMCGSALISEHLERPIYGIHVAGDIGKRVGISEAITFEQFEHLMKKTQIQEVIEPNMNDIMDDHIKPRSHYMAIGTMPFVLSHRESGKSKVIPTECSGEIFPVKCAPPVLSYKDERIKDNPFCPLQEGIDKHGLITTNFHDELVSRAYDDLKRLILAKVKPVRGKVGKLSKNVAVLGDPNIESFEKLDFNTSEGFPYSSCRPKNCKSKIWLLNLEQKDNGEYIYKGCDPMLSEIMKMKKIQRLNRQLPFTVFTDCLKDRKLPLEKVLVPGKVRVFSISPLDYTIQSRQYLMDFSSSYKDARLDVEHAIGIDVNSIEWTNLAFKLIGNSKKIVTADYSNFGPALNLVCARKAFEIIREWYKYYGDDNVDNDIIREMLGYEVIYSIHMAHGTVYRTLSGLPSGGPLTVVQNSLVNCLYIRIAWLIVFSNNIKFATLEAFHNNVKIFVYGDDLIASVKEDVADIFNCVSIAEVLSRNNIVIKNATKADTIVKYFSLLDKETTFLKNNFVPHPSRHLFLAALDTDSVEDTLNWTFKEWQYKLREISIEASDATIRNAFGHGPKYYSFVRNKVFDYWSRKGEFMTTPTWDEIELRNYPI